ncbi:MAG: signal peptidase I [bacterium]|nr:signal peptidase I [bacterium]
MTWKKFFHFLSSVLLYSLLLILVIVSILIVIYLVDQFLGKKNNENRPPLFGAYVIISPSMVPNINVYDAVFTMRVKEEKIQLYDIITFLSKEIETNGTPITHRVIGILETEKGEKVYRTKGDNNPSPDRALILYSEVLGKVLFRIPMIGHIKTFIFSRLGWFIVVVLPCLGIVVYHALKITGIIRKKVL